VSVQRRVRAGRARWEVRWREGSVQRSRTFPDKDAALEFEVDVRKRKRLGAYAPADPSREPLVTWMRTWWKREAHGWARSTRMLRSAVMDKWITPFIGEVPLRELGEDRVEEWLADIRADGCSDGQSNTALGILSTSLAAARRARRIPANPCQGIRRRKVTVARPKALTPMQVETIRSHLARPIDSVLVSLLAYAGLRPEEALALRWCDVGTTTIVVARAWTHGELRERTKTGRIRTVDITPPLLDDLEAIKPKAGGPDDLVFPSPTGRFIDLHNWRERVFKPAAATAGIKSVPYDLRHTYVSLLIHEGRSVPYVAAMAGHSARVCLERYAHAFAEAQGMRAKAPMARAITQARKKLGVRPVCDVRILRAAA
jgi:integrase